MKDTPQNQDQIMHALGVIAGELRGIVRQGQDLQAVVHKTQEMVHSIHTEMAALQATQQAMQAQQNVTAGRVDLLEQRVNKQEIIAAKHGSVYGAAAAVGMTMIVEGLRFFVNR